jgi:PAS domain S-box-containing protein
MVPQSIGTTLSFVGTFIELGMCVLLTALLLGLRRQERVREYFRFWTRGWIALCIAIAAVVIRYNVVPRVEPIPSEQESSAAVVLLYLVYQTGKLLFLLWLALGIWSYVTRAPLGRGVRVGAVLGVLAYAAVSVLGGGDLNRIVMLQAVVAAPVFLAAAWKLGTVEPARREVGDSVLGATLLVEGLLWVFYFFAFRAAESGYPGAPFSTVLGFLARYNSFFDAGLFVVLGIGMVLVLVEHSHRDAEQAQIDRIREVTAVQWRLAETLQAAQDGILTLDRNHRIEDLNGAAAAVLGLDLETATGRSFDDSIRPDHRDRLWADLSLPVPRSEAHPPVAARREVTGVRPDEDEFPLEVSLSSYGDRTVGGYVAVIRDLTEQRQAGEERDRLHQQLAQTARLETVGRMVSGVAHELNNPLTAIIAFAQDLLLTERSDEDREALTVIVQQAQRCRVIVGDLLIFARSRRDERRRVAPADLVSRVARVFERDSARYGVRFAVDVADDLPPVDIDAVGIEQVLANLLTNAFQASSSGGLVELHVRADAERLEMVVEDDGVGISPDAMPRLFEPFYTTKAPGQGTGLGLSVSHAIVEQHGGSIEAENRGDRPSGARFTVRLPFVEHRSRGAPADGDRAAAPHPSPAGPRLRRVLVIDDEAAIRSAIRRALERRGWTVDEAADGEEATLLLEVAGQLVDFDAVVTDLRMPGMSGVELYRWLTIHHPSILPRVVVVTGDTASPAVAEFLASLEGPYLQKPFDMRSLLEVLDRITAVT